MQVIFRRIEEPELWLPDYFTIVINKGMRPAQQREVCAHGIGHAALGHEDDRPKHENQADRYSSLYLVDPMELRELTSWTDDLDKIGVELGVTRQLLDAYLQWAA